MQFNKEYSNLRNEVESEVEGRISSRRAFVYSFLILFLLCVIAPKSNYSNIQPNSQAKWVVATKNSFKDKKNWLKSIPLIGGNLENVYASSAKLVMNTFISNKNIKTKDNNIGIYRISSWPTLVLRYTASCLLQFIFVVIACSPIWISASLLGFIAFSRNNSSENIESQVAIKLGKILFLPLHLTDLIVELLPPQMASQIQSKLKLVQDQYLSPIIAVTLLSSLIITGVFLSAFFSLCIIISFYIYRALDTSEVSNNILTVCKRAGGPFYSGIYGKLIPNKSPSGSEFSAPSLACPKSLDLTVSSDPLYKKIEAADAVNKTNTSLIGIIRAYGHFPAFVPEEQTAEEATSHGINDDEFEEQNAGIISEVTHTLRESAIHGLESVLEAHKKLTILADSVGENYEDHKLYRSELDIAINDTSETVRTLLQCLTPRRAIALARLPIDIVTTAYLSLEAGKSLVFTELNESGFAQCSRFPNLQARAVVQSIPEYYEDYDSHNRMIIRRALMFSRRHGDYGRAMAPLTMTDEAKSLRDWLELLYLLDEEQSQRGKVVEFDAHLEELAENWKNQLVSQIKDDTDSGILGASIEDKGVPLNTVVLLALDSVINLALFGYNEGKIDRIKHLHNSIVVDKLAPTPSARLPGLAGQDSMFVENKYTENGSSELLFRQKGGKEILKRWAIVRASLKRFNWLAGRIGDTSVPKDGLIQVAIQEKKVDRQDTPKSGIDSLLDTTGFVSLESSAYSAVVPLRQRRFEYLFGPEWQTDYYLMIPEKERIKYFANLDDYKKFIENLKDNKKNRSENSKAKIINAN